MTHPDFAHIGDPATNLIEECAELIQALTKLQRFGAGSPPYDNRAQVAAEIADVRRRIAEWEDSPAIDRLRDLASRADSPVGETVGWKCHDGKECPSRADCMEFDFCGRAVEAKPAVNGLDEFRAEIRAVNSLEAKPTAAEVTSVLERAYESTLGKPVELPQSLATPSASPSEAQKAVAWQVKQKVYLDRGPWVDVDRTTYEAAAKYPERCEVRALGVIEPSAGAGVPQEVAMLTEADVCEALRPLAAEFVASAATTRRIATAIQRAFAASVGIRLKGDK